MYKTVKKILISLVVIWLIMLVVMLSSCTTQRKCLNKFPPEIIYKDSIHIKEVIEYRDTTIFIYLPPDTVFKTDTVTLDKNGMMVSDTIKSSLELSYASAWVYDNRINLEHRVKDTIFSRLIEDAIRDHSEVKVVTKERTTIKEVNILLWWQTALMWLSLPTLLFILYSVGKVVLRLIL